jgi:hypothetical protein
MKLELAVLWKDLGLPSFCDMEKVPFSWDLAADPELDATCHEPHGSFTGRMRGSYLAVFGN